MFGNYVLAQELFEKTGFASSNISMVIKDDRIEEGNDYLKFKSVVLLYKHSLNLPKFITEPMKKYEDEFTDLSDLIPYIYFTELTDENIKSIEDKFEIVELGGGEDMRPKKFVRITDETLHNVIYDDSKIKVTVENSEIKELVQGKYIDGYIQLSNRKSLVWY